MKTLASLTEAQWNEIRQTYGVSKVLIWRAPNAEERRRHQGRPVGLRRLDDGTFEVQINYDSFRRRPQSVHLDQFTLYSLYRALAKIQLGHLDEETHQQWRMVRLTQGGQSGFKSHMAELETAASDWALTRIREDEKVRPLRPGLPDMVHLAAAA